jgi:hypothetical protein
MAAPGSRVSFFTALNVRDGRSHPSATRRKGGQESSRFQPLARRSPTVIESRMDDHRNRAPSATVDHYPLYRNSGAKMSEFVALGYGKDPSFSRYENRVHLPTASRPGASAAGPAGHRRRYAGTSSSSIARNHQPDRRSAMANFSSCSQALPMPRSDGSGRMTGESP